VPARAELQGPEFLEFPEAIAGKQMVKLSPETGQTVTKLSEFWDQMWQSSGGTGAAPRH
jgi:hypothetical protein